jgi:hypothetical protein
MVARVEPKLRDKQTERFRSGWQCVRVNAWYMTRYLQTLWIGSSNFIPMTLYFSPKSSRIAYKGRCLEVKIAISPTSGQLGPRLDERPCLVSRSATAGECC